MHSDAELHNTDNARLGLEDNTHEENEEFPDGDMHDNLDAKQNNMETRREPILQNRQEDIIQKIRLLEIKEPDQ